ncbi:hypothetical protein FRC12_007515 [Ceratobasidium sp. 428]|nr:hypothetical protein FRC12_007515 [Ceratobasidium sp. 428]
MVSGSPVAAAPALTILTVTARLRMTSTAARHSDHAGAQLAGVWRVRARRFVLLTRTAARRRIPAPAPTPSPLFTWPNACQGLPDALPRASVLSLELYISPAVRN